MAPWQVGITIFFFLHFRYLILSAGAFYFFWVFRHERYSRRRIQADFPPAAALWREIRWSSMTFLVFAIGAWVIAREAQVGRTQLYFSINERGVAYASLSFVGLIFAHDTYFYWLHRLIHLPGLYRYVHRVHHLSTNPSPFAAFMFHPFEAVLEGGFVVVMVYILPLHPYVLNAFLLSSHLVNVVGHLGYEFYSDAFGTHPLLKLFNTSTHHNLHHTHFNSNFGLYFNFWDRWMGTNHPRYFETFLAIRGRAQSKSIVSD